MSSVSKFFRWFFAVSFLIICACGQNTNNLSPDPTEEEMAMPEARYYSTEFSAFPDEVMEAVAQGPVSTEKALPFEEIDQLTLPGYLELENGYTILDDGTAYIAVRTDFPGTTGKMVKWWFWWHALKDIRYKIWCPGDHYAIGVDDLDRFMDKTLPYEERILDNPQYPVEDVGSGVMNLSIRFVAPHAFGFDESTFEEHGIEAVICGVVGFRLNDATLEHTYMCHVFRKKSRGRGLELRSRFWLGKALPYPRLRKLFINEDLTVGMLLHNAQEYNHLAGFLPAIYREFKDQD